jgi:hypothetical protein
MPRPEQTGKKNQFGLANNLHFNTEIEKTSKQAIKS